MSYFAWEPTPQVPHHEPAQTNVKWDELSSAALQSPGGQRAAGWATSGETARRVLQPGLFDPELLTPEKHESRLKRRGSRSELDEADHKPNWSGHGKPSKRSQSVGSLLQARSAWHGADVLQERSEAIYESSKREPLARAFRRDTLPASVYSPEFRFGRDTNAPRCCTGQTGQDAIFPSKMQTETDEAHEQYKRSHYAFAPGEQVQRKYAWPAEVSEDPGFRFGQPTTAAKRVGRNDSVGNALFGGAWSDEADLTSPNQRSAFKEKMMASIGTPVRTPIRPPVPKDFAFGTPSKSSDDAREAIRGNYSPEEQLPDRDLGKCIKPGRRNLTFEPEIAHGKPSDLSRMQDRRHVKCSPSEACDDFTKPRCQEEVRSLLRGIGCKLPPREFNDLWTKAEKFMPSPPGHSSSSSHQASLEAVAKVFAERRSTSVTRSHLMTAPASAHWACAGA